MACIDKLAIRGIRSFDDKQISVIEFFTPVTVIVGHNGSGKTTIIECLKYATTGDQPPNTRGGAFVHDPKMANEKEVKAQVKLRFFAANGTRMLAVRNLSVSVKKTAGLTMKTLESVLGLADGNADKGGKRGVISTKCAEMDSEIPHLLGVSKSVLENVIFCHQEDSYWPLAEPAALKKKFDDIFEATRYTKALDSIKNLRKERVADLKAEKERMESLAREKAHADKLKGRIGDCNSTIAAKEIEYEETKQRYDELVVANQKFYDYATKFRELYIYIENLQEKKKRFKADLDEAKENLQEVEGTDDELNARLQNFDNHIAEQKQKKRSEESNSQDVQDDMDAARKTHVELVNRHGELSSEAKAQERRIQDREVLIRDISEKHNIKGYSHSPLEREKVVDFVNRLGDIQRRQKTDFEKLQSDARTKNEEYNKQSRKLHAILEGHKAQKNAIKDQISDRQTSITAAEKKLEVADALPGELQTLAADMEERKKRLEKVKGEIKAAKYEEKIAERTSKARQLDDRRDELNAELRSLSLQADSRARLDIKRTEMKSKSTDVKNTIESTNVKYRKLVGTDAKAENMEKEIERVTNEKEAEGTELESHAGSANKSLQEAETVLSNLKSQLKVKKDELKSANKQLKGAFDEDTLDEAIKAAAEELSLRTSKSASISGTSAVYESMLRTGKSKKKCVTCNRGLNDQEMILFENYLKEQIKQNTPEEAGKVKKELQEWQEELDRLQKLIPFEATRKRLENKEIPNLQQQVTDQEALVPGVTTAAEEAEKNLVEVRKCLKELGLMKQHAIHVSRTQKDIDRLKQEIASIERDLSETGSTKTADDVQEQLDTLSAEIRSNERDKQHLTAERERQVNVTRGYESDIHAMQLRENDLKNRLRDKDALEEQVRTLRKEASTLSTKLKGMDSKILDAQAPIERLEQEHKELQAELNTKINEAQRASQDLNMSVDKLDGTNKAVERYVRDKCARQLQDCAAQIEVYQAKIKEYALSIEEVRGRIAAIDKEINESGASMANLRENIRIRKLIRDIAATQAEIDSHDMEEAAKSRRNFQEKYKVEKQKESDMQSKHSHIGGELSSHKAQLKTWENDLKEYKDINKRYTEQLIKVKMSDMANSDLEKYAKALDNAIMKYHGLKMEEVNDTMRHLWNKTYQGTDIDGIKIRSDVEGGATKRSYNYRVVMTKDQVEMDMRGRCSAGQKMLASIIIRLALSDSFGQNCGILALDEPTNALDTENIDALAASLVDIINERKSHSNFQLIIITHDENFLRKLGQSNVMEYYWRVSRDSRQKSVIERQRFR